LTIASLSALDQAGPLRVLIRVAQDHWRIGGLRVLEPPDAHREREVVRGALEQRVGEVAVAVRDLDEVEVAGIGHVLVVGGAEGLLGDVEGP
jgi:hypothetical protein